VIRKTVLALSLLVIALGTVAVSSSVAGASVHGTVTFTGSISCKVATSSEVTSRPGLETTTPRKVKFTVSATLVGCKGKTSKGGAKIVSGALTGKATGSYDCEDLLSPPPLKGKIVWTTIGKAAAGTAITFSSGALSFPNLTYTSTQTGSFAGTGSVSLTIKGSEDALLAVCGTKKGLTKIKLSSGQVSLG